MSSLHTSKSNNTESEAKFYYNHSYYGRDLAWKGIENKQLFRNINQIFACRSLDNFNRQYCFLQFSVQAFPYPEHTDYRDVFTEAFSVLLPLFTVLSFVMLCPSTMKRVVEEKESGVKVCMLCLIIVP